jgi:hypothetical protein
MKGIFVIFFLAALASVCIGEEAPTLIGGKHPVEPESIEHWVEVLEKEHHLNVTGKYTIHNPLIQVVNGILYDFYLEDHENNQVHHIVFITRPWIKKDQEVEILNHDIMHLDEFKKLNLPHLNPVELLEHEENDDEDVFNHENKHPDENINLEEEEEEEEME